MNCTQRYSCHVAGLHITQNIFRCLILSKHNKMRIVWDIYIYYDGLYKKSYLMPWICFTLIYIVCLFVCFITKSFLTYSFFFTYTSITYISIGWSVINTLHVSTHDAVMSHISYSSLAFPDGSWRCHICLLNRLFGHRRKNTSKLRVSGLCEGNSLMTGEFPAQRASNAENVSIWWRHHRKRFPH